MNNGRASQRMILERATHYFQSLSVEDIDDLR